MQAVSKFSIININKMCTFFRGVASLLQSPNGAGEIKLLNSGTLELLDSGTGDVLDPGAHKILNSGTVVPKLFDSREVAHKLCTQFRCSSTQTT